MKRSKKLLSLALCAAMALSLLAGCGSGDKSNSGNTSNPGGNAGGSSETGRVYWLNFKPELDGTAQALAETYTQKTGVPVQVVTAASGTYNQTLIAEMDKSAPPTLFVIGKAAFQVQGSWEYAGYKDAVPNATMIPYYCGVAGEEKAGLNCGTENCWAINANVSEADQKATMDFMVWLVSDPEASAKMVGELGIMPYQNAVESTNGFLNDAAEYSANGCYVMNWATNFQPNVDQYRATLVAALNQYNNDQSAANWDMVRTAFVDGWAMQYQAVNG